LLHGVLGFADDFGMEEMRVAMLASHMPFVTLVVNCGSSSVKLAIIADDGRRIDSLSVEGVGATPTLTTDGVTRPVAAPDLAGAISVAFAALERHGPALATVTAVGHRIVHGGERYRGPTLVTDEIVSDIDALSRYAPLHNPPAVAALRAARRLLPDVPHVAVFDTAFHATLPRRAREYAIPAEIRERLGLRRFGFHGTSHDYVTTLAARHMGIDRGQLRIVSAHLGAGASMAAVEYGRSVDTSMGLTPLEGLVGATRCGDVDPGLLLTLLREGYTAEQVDRMLNRESGFLGLTGSADVRDVEQRAAQGDEACRLALDVYAYGIRKYIGAFAAAMGGIDTLVFTGGVGQNSITMRRRILDNLGFLGLQLDDDRNADGRVTADRPVADIAADVSRCRILVVATDEEAAIAAATQKLIATQRAVTVLPPIPIAISARHVHLTVASVETLFGPGHRLTVFREISQPGQYAANESVRVIGPKGQIERVRVVGPERVRDQVEISRTDGFMLGLNAPVRESGDVAESPGLRLEGPAGSIVLSEGVICAMRHVHMTPQDAQAYGVSDGDTVQVRAGTSGGRALTFADVRVRVSDRFRLEMHIDTDEANAAGIGAGAHGVLIGPDRTDR
jgi:acetate kinase